MADCLHPVTIRNKGKGPAYIAVPCGKCPKCLATKLNKWVFRLKQHAKSFKYVYFCTLTYDDEHLPYIGDGRIFLNPSLDIIDRISCEGPLVPCLYKPHLQKFFRRIRKWYNMKFQEINIFSYYAIGEYGSDTDRPHYHILLFTNLEDFSSPDKAQEVIFSFWNNGFVDVKQVTDFRIQYVCKHHLKPKNSKWFPVNQFTLRSNGLGLGFLDKDVVKWFRDNKPTVIHQRDGVKIGVPRYYRTKLMEMYGIDTSVAYIQRKTPLQKLHESYSGDTLDRVMVNRKIYEEHLENQNLYKSKNKRK